MGKDKVSNFIRLIWYIHNAPMN